MSGPTLREELHGLEATQLGFGAKLLDKDGNLHTSVKVFVADDALDLQGFQTEAANNIDRFRRCRRLLKVGHR